MTLMQRRRALMGAQNKGTPFAMVDGTINSITVSGRTVEISNGKNIKFISGGDNSRFKIPFTKPLVLNSGDVVKFESTNRSFYNTSVLNIGFNTSFFTTGGNFCPFQPTTKTVTLTEAMTAEYLYISPPSAFNGNNFDLVLRVNGNQILPEV